MCIRDRQKTDLAEKQVRHSFAIRLCQIIGNSGPCAQEDGRRAVSIGRKRSSAMSKIAFIFPGQGAQVCGMGQDFYEQTETGKQVFDTSTEILCFSMPEPVSYTHLVYVIVK